MRLDKITNLHLNRIIKMMGIDDLKLITLTNNYGLHQLKNTPEHETAVLTAITNCCQRLKASRAKQKEYLFYEIQSDLFLLKTDEQQNSLINSMQQELRPADAIEFQNLDVIVSFANKHDLDLIAVMDWIEKDHPFFPCCEVTQTQIQAYITYFIENAATYRTIKTDTARIYSDFGYRGINHQPSIAKS